MPDPYALFTRYNNKPNEMLGVIEGIAELPVC